MPEAQSRRFYLSFASFKSRVNSLPKSQEIIFYWAWPGEASAVGQAAKYQAQGFTNVKVLKGGVEGWKAAGYAMNWSLHAAIPAHQVRNSHACRLFVRLSRLDFQSWGGNADAVEALVCKTGLSGFESHRYLHCPLRLSLAMLWAIATWSASIRRSG
jgi:3-mercaptopyruvate sulfurtransferase SseA